MNGGVFFAVKGDGLNQGPAWMPICSCRQSEDGLSTETPPWTADWSRTVTNDGTEKTTYQR
jgi:hypothetical protein